jgi:uncharacterized protein
MIQNITRRSVVAKDETYCVSAKSKAKGLMFSKRKGAFCLVLVFNKPVRIGLHMWFVFYPIDVIFADAGYDVVDLKRSFLPFLAYTSKEKAVYAIELPEGTIARSKTHVGDALEFSTDVSHKIR